MNQSETDKVFWGACMPFQPTHQQLEIINLIATGQLEKSVKRNTHFGMITALNIIKDAGNKGERILEGGVTTGVDLGRGSSQTFQHLYDTDDHQRRDAETIRRLGAQCGHKTDMDQYINHTPFKSAPFPTDKVDIMDLMENLCEGLTRGEYKTFEWKLLNDFPQGFTYLTKHGKTAVATFPEQYQALFNDWFDKVNEFTPDSRIALAVPTQRWDEMDSFAAAQKETVLRNVQNTIGGPRPNLKKEDPTRVARHVNKITKSRNAAKAAKKARKKK